MQNNGYLGLKYKVNSLTGQRSANQGENAPETTLLSYVAFL